MFCIIVKTLIVFCEINFVFLSLYYIIELYIIFDRIIVFYMCITLLNVMFHINALNFVSAKPYGAARGGRKNVVSVRSNCSVEVGEFAECKWGWKGGVNWSWWHEAWCFRWWQEFEKFFVWWKNKILLVVQLMLPIVRWSYRSCLSNVE